MASNSWPSYVIGKDDRYVYDYQEGNKDRASTVNTTDDLDQALRIDNNFTAHVIAQAIRKLPGCEDFAVLPVDVTIRLRKIEPAPDTEPNDTLKEAYSEGYGSFTAWQWNETGSEPVNPYDAGSPEYSAWENGSTQAQKDW